MYVDRDGGSFDQKVVLSNAERKTVEQLNHDLEEQRELATNRLSELETMNNFYKTSLKEVEKLKMELSTLPEHVVVETTEHKCLQSQFSVLYNEAMQLKTQLEDARNQLQVILIHNVALCVRSIIYPLTLRLSYFCLTFGPGKTSFEYHM